ncbi:peptidase S8/S53 domain-containing protein [Tricharina praecox]|uniref:peptidase S8/S53 domain-containing protein n=1 Tax=Tricharina praecox TaxID=43433 RepID=UPI0022212273|nr:peptidase S8/S53 domain-containing protein [Tricharina praecox]KAI5843595.1 peptidase S8/S53 domain-containing protein [Tricharina praecox]
MRFSLALLSLLLAPSLVLAAPVEHDDYIIFESHPAPEGWRTLPTAPAPSTHLTLRIHLTTAHSLLEDELLAVSDPTHARYGDHHTQTSLRAFTAAAPEAVSAVTSWLSAHDLESSLSASGDVIKTRVTLEQAQSLLRTTYHKYHNTDGRTIVRTTEYSVPVAVKRFIEMVQPTTMFGLQRMGATHEPLGMTAPARTATQTAAACNSSITLKCLANLYGYGGYRSKGKASVGVSGFLEQYAQFDDFTTFLEKYRPAAAGANFSVVSVNGGLNLQNVTDINAFVEANLDIQYTVGISYPAENTYFSTAGRPPFVSDLDVTENNSEPYLEYLEYLLSQRTLPSVLSTSYGESEQTVPLSYRLSVCNQFARLGARGVSVIFASGDSGTGWSCKTNDGTNSTRFQPVFPAACPWVTSVGGTEGVAPEHAVDFSSGGFSETWEAPAYQRSTIARYFRTQPAAWRPYVKYFNTTGRGFPDVAAQASNYEVVLGGSARQVSGTSAAAPVFAGIIALVNDYRQRRGKKCLGFLNPALYRNPKAFTDVTTGRSTGCDGIWGGEPIEGGPGIVPGAGWNATVGWDPVTGLGTPKFGALKDI